MRLFRFPPTVPPSWDSGRAAAPGRVPQGGSPPLPPSVKSAGAKKPGICDIGTEILYFQCFVTTDMFLFCKPIIFSGNCRICRDLAFGSVKTRFKAILKKLDFSAQIDFSAHIYLFHELLPPEGDFSAQNYFFNELLPPEGDFSAQI